MPRSHAQVLTRSPTDLGITPPATRAVRTRSGQGHPAAATAPAQKPPASSVRTTSPQSAAPMRRLCSTRTSVSSAHPAPKRARSVSAKDRACDSSSPAYTHHAAPASTDAAPLTNAAAAVRKGKTPSRSTRNRLSKKDVFDTSPDAYGGTGGYVPLSNMTSSGTVHTAAEVEVLRLRCMRLERELEERKAAAAERLRSSASGSSASQYLAPTREASSALMLDALDSSAPSTPLLNGPGGMATPDQASTPPDHIQTPRIDDAGIELLLPCPSLDGRARAAVHAHRKGGAHAAASLSAATAATGVATSRRANGTMPSPSPVRVLQTGPAAPPPVAAHQQHLQQQQRVSVHAPLELVATESTLSTPLQPYPLNPSFNSVLKANEDNLRAIMAVDVVEAVSVEGTASASASAEQTPRSPCVMGGDADHSPVTTPPAAPTHLPTAVAGLLDDLAGESRCRIAVEEAHARTVLGVDVVVAQRTLRARAQIKHAQALVLLEHRAHHRLDCIWEDEAVARRALEFAFTTILTATPACVEEVVRIDTRAEELEELRRGKSEVQAKFDRAQERVKELELQLREEDKDNCGLREEVAALRARAEAMADSLETAEATCEHLEGEVEDLITQRNSLQECVDGIESMLYREGRGLDGDSLGDRPASPTRNVNDQLELLTRVVVGTGHTLETAHEEILHSSLSATQEKYRELRNECDDLQAEKDALDDTFRTLQSQFRESQERNMSLESTISGEHAALTASLKNAEARNAVLSAELQRYTTGDALEICCKAAQQLLGKPVHGGQPTPAPAPAARATVRARGSTGVRRVASSVSTTHAAAAPPAAALKCGCPAPTAPPADAHISRIVVKCCCGFEPKPNAAAADLATAFLNVTATATPASSTTNGSFGMAPLSLGTSSV